MNFKSEDTHEFVLWLSNTRDNISQVMSKLTIKENLSEADESFLEEMHQYYYLGCRDLT